MRFELTEGQKEARDACLSGNNVLVIGKPGSGKSTLIQELVRILGDKLLIGSTTGISNQRLLEGKGGSGSMHRIFSLPTNIFTQENRKKVSKFTGDMLGKNHNIEYILIDEAGFLLNADLLKLIQLRIQRYNKRQGNRPKRDIKLLLFGDFLQIPPIFSKLDKEYMTENYGNPLFFKSHTFEEMNFKVVNMHQVMRTDNNTFLQALDVMRYGQEDRYEKLCVWLNKVMYKHSIPRGIPLMAVTNKKADEANMRALRANPKPSFYYQADVEGKYKAKDCPAGEYLEIKEDCLVMTLVNDLENGNYQNGSVGRVTLCTSEGCWVKFHHSKKEEFVEVHEFTCSESKVVGEEWQPDGTSKSIVSTEVTGKCRMLPVKLAYGLSVHKNQGENISSPCQVDLGIRGFNKGSDFGCALAYVALSRFTDPSLVYLTYPITPDHIKCDKEILDWVLSFEGHK